MKARAFGHALFALLGLGTADLVALNAWAIPGVLAVDAARPKTRDAVEAPRPAANGGVEGAGGSDAPATDFNAATQPPSEAPPQAIVTHDGPSEPDPKLERDPALLLFHKGTWWIGPASRQAIRSSLERISRSRVVELEGHADADGSSEINQRISENRAVAVQAYLTGTGIKPESIRIRAVGETQASGTALDRRVEIWIEP
jgi:outer membrane protein OmpA-like peptidoglycan-associated protein